MTTKTETTEDPVTKLVNEAASAVKSEDAMRFSQAALNCANALECVRGGLEYEKTCEALRDT